MSKLSRFRFKRLRKRTSRYQLSVLGIALLFGWILLGGVVPYLYQAWMDFGPRTPLGHAERVSVLISMDHLSDQQQLMIKSQPTAVVAHQVQPRLKLVGVGQRVIERKTDRGSREALFELGLLPQNAEEILRTDTQMSLRIQAPSVELLAQDLINSPRGQALKRSLSMSQKRVTQSWSEIFPIIKKTFKKYLTPEELARVLQDDVVISRLKEAFMVEIGARVNVDQLGDQLRDSEAVAELGQLAMKHVNMWGVLRESLGGGMTTLKQEAGQISREAGRAWSKNIFIFDLGFCALKASPFMPSVLSRRLGNSPLCKRVFKAPERIVKEAAKEGAVDLFKQSLESVKREAPQVLDQSSKLAQELKEATQAPILLKRFWKTLNSDETLARHIQDTYQGDLLLRFQLALRDLSAIPEVSQRLETLKDEVQNIARDAFKAIVLDREGKGPNPLLLAVIQEQLSGRARPIIHIIPGAGENIKSGYLFTSQHMLNGTH